MVNRSNLCRWALVVVGTMLFLQGTLALYEDQVGMYDWHQQYIGQVKLADFQSSGQRKRVFVATEQGVVAALNLRTGDIAWRQELGAEHSVDALQVNGKYLVTVSGGGRFLRSWSVVDGTMGWDATMIPPPATETGPEGVQLHLLAGGKESAGPHDVVLLSRGTMYRFSGTNGALLWQAQVDASSLWVDKDHSTLTAVGFSGEAGGTATGIVVTRLSMLGKMSRTLAASFGKSVSTSSSVVTGGSLVTIDSLGSALLVTSLTSDTLAPKNVDIRSLVEVEEGSRASLSPATFASGFGLGVGGRSLVVQLGAGGQMKVVLEVEGEAVMSDHLVAGAEESVTGVMTQQEGVNFKVGVGRKGQMRIGVGAGAGLWGKFGVGVGFEVEVAAKLRHPALLTWGEKVYVVQVVTQAGATLSGPDLLYLPPHRGRVSRLFLNSYLRKTGDSFGFRALVVGEEHSLCLLQQGEVVWSREEALASVVGVQFVDPPLPLANLAADPPPQGEVATLEARWQQWVLSTKAALLLASPQEQGEMKQRALNSVGRTGPTRDAKGFRKFLVLLTKTGKLFALHSGNGRIMWASLPGPYRTGGAAGGAPGGAARPQQMLLWKDPHRRALEAAPEVVVIGARGGREEGVVTYVNAHTGAVLSTADLAFPVQLVVQLPLVDSAEQKLLLLIEPAGSADRPPVAHLLPPSPAAQELLSQHRDSISLYTVDEGRGVIQGFGLTKQGEAEEVWRVVFPREKEAIAALAARSKKEGVHTQVKVKGNREVEYKFLLPTLLFVATVTPTPEQQQQQQANLEEGSVTAYLLDTVTGRVMHRVTHSAAQGPVHAVVSENWVVYHYFNLRTHRYEVSVMELYDDSPEVPALQIGKYVLGLGGGNLSGALSAWSPPPLRVVVQTYFLTPSLKAMTVTATAEGITNKQVLVGTMGNQVLALDKRLLDPRRSLTPSQQEREEGLLPYTDTLPINPQAYLTHRYQVAGLRGIVTEPSRLESTTLVFAYGLDLFYIRTAPSRMYDSLTEDFSYSLLVLTIVGLLVAIVVAWGLAERQELQMKWK